MTTTEQSVEQALAELREMFPRTTVSVEQYERHVVNYRGRRLEPVRYAVILAGDCAVMEPTLGEAVERVRQWHAEQAKESKG